MWIIRLLKWLTLSEGTAIPFAIWLFWLFWIDGGLLGTQFIESNMTGAFIVAGVIIYYTSVQALSAMSLACCESRLASLWDTLISIIPLFVILITVIVWFLPGFLEMPALAETLGKVTEVTLFKMMTMAVAALAVIFDVFWFSSYSQRVEEYVDQRMKKLKAK